MPTRILIKADDLVYGERNRMWRGFAKAAKERGIPASIGVIGFDSLNAAERNPGKGDWITKYLPEIELWNHGYYHTHEEFRGQPGEVQMERISHTQEAIETLYGVRSTVFGAPFNIQDQATVAACEALGLAGVFSDGNVTSAARIELRRIFGFEIPRPKTAGRVVNPGLLAFWRRYRRFRKWDFAVMQVHPRRWDADGIRKFGWILDFLLRRGCTFVRLSDVVAERPTP